MIQLEENEIEVLHVVNEGFVKMLGDTGAQGHVSPPRGNIDKEKHYGYVKMANGVKSKIYQKDNVIIKDEVGNTLELNNRRVVDGIATHIRWNRNSHYLSHSIDERRLDYERSKEHGDPFHLHE
jgi:hypothetical protein